MSMIQDEFLVYQITSFVVGVFLGALFVAAVAYPRVGRLLARLIAVALGGVGSGMLVWALYAIAQDATLQAIRFGAIAITEPSEAIGWAVGLLIASLLALGFSFLEHPS